MERKTIVVWTRNLFNASEGKSMKNRRTLTTKYLIMISPTMSISRLVQLYKPDASLMESLRCNRLVLVPCQVKITTVTMTAACSCLIWLTCAKKGDCMVPRETLTMTNPSITSVKRTCVVAKANTIRRLTRRIRISLTRKRLWWMVMTKTISWEWSRRKARDQLIEESKSRNKWSKKLKGHHHLKRSSLLSVPKLDLTYP